VFLHLVLVDHGSNREPNHAGIMLAGLRRTSLAMRVSRRSVACRSSSRLRARSLASAELRQATSRSPGNSGEVISARSRSSNRESCKWPSISGECGDLRRPHATDSVEPGGR
jgi:hypothetical protein